MHYLLTGGAGFIGSWLSRELCARGHTVTALDDGSAGELERLRIHCPGIAIERGSAGEPERVDPLVSACDVVVHLAAAVGVERVANEPERCRTLNARTTRCTLDAAIRHRRRYVFASSSEIYGTAEPPFVEAAARAPRPGRTGRFSYARSKWRGERLVRTAARRHGLEGMILRFFNTVGPGQSGRHGMVLPRFVEQALREQPLEVHGDGLQTRCFADVRDVVTMVADLMDSGRGFGRTVNIGDDRPITIRALAHRVAELAGSASGVVSLPFDVATAPGFEAIQHRRPDLTQLRGLLGGVLRSRPLDATIRDVLGEMRESADGLVAQGAQRNGEVGLRAGRLRVPRHRVVQ